MYNQEVQTFVALLLIVLSIIGIADAGFIAYEQLNNNITPCGNGFNCVAVLSSPYAYIGPIPLSQMGLVYYSLIFVFSVMNFLNIGIQQLPWIKNNVLLKRIKAIDVLLILTFFGFIFSLYLVFVMAFVISAWCKYCLISAFTSTCLFLVTQTYHSHFVKRSSFVAKWIVLKLVRFFYILIGKPLFFISDPETVHDSITKTGNFMGQFGVVKFITRWFLQFRHPILNRTFDGIKFANPVGLSAGYDYNADLTEIIPEVGFGFQTVGTVTLEPYQGNTKPRLGRFPNSQALLVNKGLKSIGAPAIIKKLSNINFKIPIGISIGSTNKGYHTDSDQVLDILKCFLLFEGSKVNHEYYELNISCPNTFGGEPFTIPNRLEILLSALDELKITRPVYVKFPIDQTEDQTRELLAVIDQHNIEGIIIGNLTKDRQNPAVLPADQKEWEKRKGNLSGKPTFERSNAIISLTKKIYKERFTIIGTGGIFTAEDAIEKMRRGADLVQLITGMIFEGPSAIALINHGLANQLLDKRSK